MVRRLCQEYTPHAGRGTLADVLDRQTPSDLLTLREI